MSCVQAHFRYLARRTRVSTDVRVYGRDSIALSAAGLGYNVRSPMLR